MAYAFSTNARQQLPSYPGLQYQKQETNPVGSHITSLECSAVRENVNSDHMLGGSEVSWLDKIEEENLRMSDPPSLERESDKTRQKQIKEMKFSFNANQLESADAGPRKPTVTAHRQQTLKQIYYQQFQKEARRIKEVQQARRAMLASLHERQKGKRNASNKQNLVGSIRRLNQSDKRLANAKDRFEHNNNDTKKYNAGREQEELQIKLLQESLAKRHEARIPLSKLSYLEESKTNKEQSASKEGGLSIKVREFEAREEEFESELSLLFDQLDGKKLGKIYRQNCSYQQLQEQLKIAFGSIFVELVFKDLLLSKQEFVKLASKRLQQIDSIQLNSILREIKTVPTLSQASHTKKTEQLDQTIKRKQAYQAENKKETKTVEQSLLQHKMINLTENWTINLPNSKTGYSSVPTAREGGQESKDPLFALRANKVASRIKPQIQKLQPLTKNIAEQMLARYNEGYLNLQKNQQLCKEYLLSLHTDHPFRDVPPSIRKKIRNISQEMIRQHKRNLDILNKLNALMENCLSVSRRKLQSFSSDKYHHNVQNSLSVQKVRNMEFMTPYY